MVFSQALNDQPPEPRPAVTATGPVIHVKHWSGNCAGLRVQLVPRPMVMCRNDSETKNKGSAQFPTARSSGTLKPMSSAWEPKDPKNQKLKKLLVPDWCRSEIQHSKCQVQAQLSWSIVVPLAPTTKKRSQGSGRRDSTTLAFHFCLKGDICALWDRIG